MNRANTKGLRLVVACTALLSLCSTIGLAGAQIANDASGHSASVLGFAVSTGAAPGYVADKACGSCHQDLYKSYQAVGMARSFAPAASAVKIENFSAPAFYHAPSQRYYEMRRAGNGILFRRYQRDADGEIINLLEQPVHWVMGSGNKTRSYLYQTPAGEIYELPLGWYSETRQWQMSPGYEGANHHGINRVVRRECMFCHNAYPQVAAGSDASHQPQIFPADLPSGIGCQRCHGPGAEHMRRVLDGQALEQVQTAIVNPAKLPADQRDSVCFQCHMLPAVALVGSRRMGRATYSYRPGEVLDDYLLHVDVTDPGLPKEQRFEINHHAYRLRQSACYAQSAGALTCISCHDPHRKPALAERLAKTEATCMQCHEKHVDADARSDCASCHMPQRRTQDVIHVTMTDHRIGLYPESAEQRLAPLARREPQLHAIGFLRPELAPAGAEGDLYKALTLVRQAPLDRFVNFLAQQIQHLQPSQLEAYLVLAEGYLKLRRFAEAESVLLPALQRFGDSVPGLQALALAYMGQGKLDQAAKIYAQLDVENSQEAELHFNFSLLLIQQDKPQQAMGSLVRALALRPNFAVAHYYRAKLLAQLQQPEQAVLALQQALAVAPEHTRFYDLIVQLLQGLGRHAEAEKYRGHGLRVALNPEQLRPR